MTGTPEPLDIFIKSLETTMRNNNIKHSFKKFLS